MPAFVKYYTHLEGAFSDLAAAFTEQNLLLKEWGIGAYRDGEGLSARIGLGGSETPLVAKNVDVRLEDRYASADKAVLSISWTATGPTALFPRMQADLILEPLGPDLSQLSLQGSYAPPLGAPGKLLDRWVLHRVAEASVKNLVDRVALALSARNGESPE